ncbi:MAG: Tex-like N-terminal domain-containing protein [Pseudomonadota bacterium]
MNGNTFTSKIAREQNISGHHVQAVADFLAQGATIPFIARYRKEATGSLDEVAVAAIRDRINQLREIEDRKKAIFTSLEKHGHLTDALSERVLAAENLLDASAVHPESYHIVDAMARDLGAAVSDLMKNPEIRGQIDVLRYVTESVGIPTLKDILDELAKPGRDPREQFEAFSFADGIEKIEDLRPQMKLPGIVTNVTAFGAFVDIGIHQDGLVHISQMSDRFVKDPSDIVKVHQKVSVTVIDVDLARNRISLSMKSSAGHPDPDAKTSGATKNLHRGPKPEKTKSPKPAFNRPMAAALIKSGLKQE